MKETFVWDNPKSEAESDAIINDAKELFISCSEDVLESACKKLALFAGSFNHFWTYAHRVQIINLLVDVGDNAIDPVLQALVDIPRAEQFDLTIKFIRKLVKRGAIDASNLED